MGGRTAPARLAACVAGLCLLLTPASAQTQDLGRIFSDILHQRLPGDTVELSQGEVSDGLIEALAVATDRASAQLGTTDGFLRDPVVHISLPGLFGDVQGRLKPFGMSGPLDDLETRINRGAESAMPAARTLVVDAVRSMTFEDAMSILRGGDTAATDLLRQRTEVGLKRALTPYVESALADAGALEALEAVVGRYLAGFSNQDARQALVGTAVDGAVDGLFHYVAREESAIRRDPVKRSSEILRKVFGG